MQKAVINSWEINTLTAVFDFSDCLSDSTPVLTYQADLYKAWGELFTSTVFEATLDDAIKTISFTPQVPTNYYIINTGTYFNHDLTIEQTDGIDVDVVTTMTEFTAYQIVFWVRKNNASIKIKIAPKS